MKEKLLTISMLVSGREETTEKSLQSLQPLREQLGAEIILTDTGCRKEYLDNIRGYADKILEFTWCNDFAKARNVGLEAADGQWFMFIDDDEWFEDVTPIIKFFKSGEYEEYHQAVNIARNYSDFEGSRYTDDWVSRMIRIEDDTHFEGAVHECLVPTRGKCKCIDAFVHHYGYVFATEEERQAHFKRNVDILSELMKGEPNNLKWPLQLIKELFSTQNYEEMKKVSLKALEKIENVDDSFINMCRGSFYLGVLEAELQAERYDEMWNTYDSYMQNDKNPWNVRCALAAYMLLHASEDEVRLQNCVNDYVNGLDMHDAESYDEQQQIIAESIVFVSEYMYRLVSFAEDVKQSMVGNGEFLFLPQRVWTLARLGVLPLEEMLLSLPMGQWIAQMKVLQMNGYSNKWGEISSQLASICTQNDIRYSYFDMVLEIIKMKQIYSINENIVRMNYETMTEIITDFAQANLNYMDYMYTEAAYEGDMELFSEEEKASLWIANALSVDMSQWKVKLQYLGEAAKACPMLGDFIKRYMKLLGEELMK